MKPLQSSIFRSFLSVACLSSFGLISTSALSGPYQVCPQARPNPYGGYGSILPICASHIPLSQAHTLSTYGVLGRPGQVGQGPKVERQTPIQGAGLVLCTPPNGYTWSDEYHGINVYAGSDRVFPRGAGDMVHHGTYIRIEPKSSGYQLQHVNLLLHPAQPYGVPASWDLMDTEIYTCVPPHNMHWMDYLNSFND